MQNIKLYTGNWMEKILLLGLYSWVGSSLLSEDFTTVAAVVLGVWLGHWIVRSILRWGVFLAWGKILTASMFVADFQANGLPRPDGPYECPEWYFDECLQSEETNARARNIASGWRAVIDFLRGQEISRCSSRSTEH